MTVPGILRALEEASLYRDALAWAHTDADLGLVDGLDAPVLAGLLAKRAAAGHPAALLAVVPTGRRAESVAQALETYVPDAGAHLPGLGDAAARAPQPQPGHGRPATADPAPRRRMDGERPLVVVASVRAALQPIAGNLGDIVPLELTVGSRGNELDHVAEQLVERAYSRVDMVSRRGEFAVRGGILDVFPPTSEHPYRVEFFGDEIDQIRAFSVADSARCPATCQASTSRPAASSCSPPRCGSGPGRSSGLPAISGMLEKMAEGIPVEGMESLLPAVAGPLKSLVEYLPEGTATAVIDPERSTARALTLGETNREFLDAAWSAATSGASAPIDLGAGDFLTIADLREVVRDRGGVWWRLSPFGIGDATAESVEAATVIPSFHGNVDGAIAFVEAKVADGWRVVVLATGHGLVDRARDVLSDRGIAARVVETIAAAPDPGSRPSRWAGSRPASRCPRRSSPSSPTTSSTAARSAATSASSRSSRPVGRTSSTRCSSSRATSWCTPHTASAGSSR